MEDIRDNEELRGYFFDYISKNVALEFSDLFTVPELDRIRFQKESLESLYKLSEKIKEQTGSNEVMTIIENTITFYMNFFRDINSLK